MKTILLAILIFVAVSGVLGTCRENEEHRECGTPCPPTCQHPGPRACVLRCEAGCFCRMGFIRDNKTQICVRPWECPRPF